MALLVDFCELPNDNNTPEASNDRQVIPTRRVTFDHTETTFVKNLTFEHKSDLWYTKRELDSFKQDTIIALQTLRENNRMITSDNREQQEELLFRVAEDTTSFLGLERCLAPSTYRVMKTRQRALKQAIMYEQYRQREYGICDPDVLANISEVESDWSRKRSLIIGLIHADSK